MKSAILFRSILIAALPLAIAPLCSARASLAGDWAGTFNAGGNTLHLAWQVVAAQDGTLTSTIDNIDESVYGIKTKSTSVNGSSVSFSVDEQIQANGQDVHVVGSFAGTLAATGNEVNGTFTQEQPQEAALEIHFERAPQAAAPSTSPSPANQSSITGDWAGTLDAGGAQLRLILHIRTANDGNISATLDSIDQGANGIPIKSATFKDGKLNLDVEAVHGTYDGTLNKEASEIAGTWSQGQPLALNFKRAQPETAAAPKPGAPTDIDGIWSGKLETPAAMLTINLKIANMDSGLTGQIQSPDQSPNWAPANSITREGDKLTVEFKAFGATYQGKISSDNTTIDGKFNQMGNELPLVLKKL